MAGHSSDSRPLLEQWGFLRMTKLLRFTSAAVTVAALSLTSAPAFAAASTATGNPQAKASARILKPLALKSTQDLNLGTIALGTTPFTTDVGFKSGTWTCDSTKVTCSDTHQVAKYNVTGTNDRVVTISAGNVVMKNAAGDELTLVVQAPASVTLPNSGTAGRDFDIGGYVSLSQATPDGDYLGTFAVTADYE
jgi:hypothetical protein